MSKANGFENGFLLLVFNNTDYTLVGDAGGLRGSAAAGSFYFSLHTADPGEAGDQTTNEVAYTGYSRAAVARSGAGFTVTGNAVATAADVVFSQCTGGTAAATHWGLGTSSSGAGKLLYKGALGGTMNIVNNNTPRISAGTCVTED